MTTKRTPSISRIVLAISLTIGGVWCFAAPKTARAGNSAVIGTAGGFVLASAAGAALNSNLRNGGGTDDTEVLQRVLNRASKGAPIHLVIDGPALVSGLDVYANTTIECIEGGGLYLKNGSTRALIRNAHRSRTAITDEHIALRGCTLNGNRTQQVGHKDTSP